MQFTGSRLKFDQKDEAQDIFFVPETGAAVRTSVIAENKPARLMAINPFGTGGGRTKASGVSKPLKAVKTKRCAKLLTVTL